MAHDPGPPSTGLRAYLRPWPLMLAGLGLTAAGVLLSALPVQALQALCVAAGLLTAGVALGQHLETAKWDFPNRLESAGLAGLLGVSGAIGFFGMGPDWGSGRLFCTAVVVGSTIGSALILLPSLPRRMAISALVVLHFVGIVTAVTSVPPAPWLSQQLYVRVFRPYLSFVYMTNAYHFYSPEPGPTAMLWFAVHYDDGKYKWLKLPERESSPIGMHYQRMLALPQHAVQASGRPPYTDHELARLKDGKEQWEEENKNEKRFKPVIESITTLSQRRQIGSDLKKYGEYRIPMVQGWDERVLGAQYSEPEDTSKKVISSIARYVFQHPPAPETPGAKVTTVKVYRVVHRMLHPAELAAGKDPQQRNTLLPYFLGEFDGQGHMVDFYDPFLYWYLPIVKVPRGYTQPEGLPVGINVAQPEPADFKWLDCLEIHAARPHQAENNP